MMAMYLRDQSKQLIPHKERQSELDVHDAIKQEGNAYARDPRPIAVPAVATVIQPMYLLHLCNVFKDS